MQMSIKLDFPYKRLFVFNNTVSLNKGTFPLKIAMTICHKSTDILYTKVSQSNEYTVNVHTHGSFIVYSDCIMHDAGEQSASL